jgi:hypothetical protein
VLAAECGCDVVGNFVEVGVDVHAPGPVSRVPGGNWARWHDPRYDVPGPGNLYLVGFAGLDCRD